LSEHFYRSANLNLSSPAQRASVGLLGAGKHSGEATLRGEQSDSQDESHLPETSTEIERWRLHDLVTQAICTLSIGCRRTILDYIKIVK